MWERNWRRQVGKEWQATSGKERWRQALMKKEAMCGKGKAGGMCERITTGINENLNDRRE
jgi:hypothetical protein